MLASYREASENGTFPERKLQKEEKKANMNLASCDDDSLGSHVNQSSLENPQKLHNQDFEMLKEFHLENGTPFTDVYFPANMKSIGSSLKDELDSKIVWKRPKEICMEPCFTVDGTSLSDILHSRLGNCWVLSAIGSVTSKCGALDKIIPANQQFGKRYAGIFHFRLWHLGDWMDIVIDDSLPFLDGKYLSVQPSCKNEFWPCLLEKAYAKFLGSYEKLHLADPSETFVNLTGGLTMTFDLKTPEAQKYWDMIRLASQDTMMACISDKQSPSVKIKNLKPMFSAGNWKNMFKKKLPENAAQNSSLEEKLTENILQENGLVECHAYSIINYTEVEGESGTVKLIRLWNPWGSGEWKGNWNDSCPLWKQLKEEDRQRLQRINNDGKFWMCWEDFINTFSKLIICNQVPDFFNWGNQQKKWYRNMYRSRWTIENLYFKNIDKDFFARNPLYRITVTGSDEVESGVNVVVSLMQTSRNHHKYGDWLPIGFVLFEFEDSQDKIPDSILTPEKISSIKSHRQHNITEAFTLSPGRYGIIPYTTQKEHESSFLIQFFLNSKDCTKDINAVQSPEVASDDEYEQIFKLYSTKGSTLYTWDLKRLMNNELLKDYSHQFNAKFTTDGCREILASVDTFKKANIDAGTFVKLWKIYTKYKDLFNIADAKDCGYIGLTELRKIMKQQAGLNLQNDFLQQLFARYSDAQGKISFVDYMVCTMRLNGLMKTFNNLSAEGKVIQMTVEKWLQLMM